jgi:hypothetical protein
MVCQTKVSSEAVLRRTYTQLADGSYTFQVVAVGASGDPGYVAPFSFVVDSTPPAVTDVAIALQGDTPAAATAVPVGSLGGAALAARASIAFSAGGGCLNASFTAFDGVLGSGLAG